MMLWSIRWKGRGFTDRQQSKPIEKSISFNPSKVLGGLFREYAYFLCQSTHRLQTGVFGNCVSGSS